jgi:3-phosphoshikimate 1-carboxyvinyltransferase
VTIVPPNPLPDPLPIEPIRVGRRFDVAIRPPGSKSLTNRALLLAALARGTSTLHNPLTDADDAKRMLTAIQALGAKVSTDSSAPHTLHITGVGGQWQVGNEPITLDLGNAGTATRFLAAAAMLAPVGSGGIVIDGNARMRQRPIGELADALRALGGRVEHLGQAGYPPIHIHPAHPAALKNEAAFSRTASSQFISALMLIAPWLPGGLTVKFAEPPTSPTYIDMSAAILRRCGAQAKGATPGPVTIFPSGTREARGLNCFTYDVEPDASGATYFWAAAALCPGSHVLVPGLWLEGGAGPCALQGDARFVRLLHRMGAAVEFTASGIAIRGPQELLPIDADLSDMPDAAMTLAAVACFAQGPSRLSGLRTLRVKETDRIAAMVNELSKIGATVEPFAAAGDEGITITPPSLPTSDPVIFDTYDDHRMAMSLALIGLRRGGVSIRDPGCVAKTYPGYWNDLARLTQC